MLGVSQDDFARPTGDQIAYIMQPTGEDPVPIGGLTAMWAWAAWVIPALFDELGLGKIFDRWIPSVGSGKYSPGPNLLGLLLACFMPGSLHRLPARHTSYPCSHATVSDFQGFFTS